MCDQIILKYVFFAKKYDSLAISKIRISRLFKWGHDWLGYHGWHEEKSLLLGVYKLLEIPFPKYLGLVGLKMLGKSHSNVVLSVTN